MTTSQSAQNAQPSSSGTINQNKVNSSIVLKSLSILLGVFFIFIGAMKITPYLSKDLHKDLVSSVNNNIEMTKMFWIFVAVCIEHNPAIMCYMLFLL